MGESELVTICGRRAIFATLLMPEFVLPSLHVSSCLESYPDGRDLKAWTDACNKIVWNCLELHQCQARHATRVRYLNNFRGSEQRIRPTALLLTMPRSVALFFFTRPGHLEEVSQVSYFQ